MTRVIPRGEKVTKANSLMHSQFKGGCCDSLPVLQHRIHRFHAVSVHLVELISELDCFLQPLDALGITEIHQGQLFQLFQHRRRHLLLHGQTATKQATLSKFLLVLVWGFFLLNTYK